MSEQHQTGASTSFAELDALSTDELRSRAFALAESRHDLRFFLSLLSHLPHSDDVASEDGSTGSFGATIADAVALFREFTGHGYGEREPLLRAAFIDYLQRSGR